MHGYDCLIFKGSLTRGWYVGLGTSTPITNTCWTMNGGEEE